jgi:hypothetical protein
MFASFVGRDPGGVNAIQVEVGSPVPNVYFLDSDANAVPLSALVAPSRPAALLISYAGCGGCQAEIIRWREVGSRNPALEFHVIIVAESSQEALSATRGVIVPDSVYRMPIQQWRALGERRIPLMILLSPRGDIIWKGAGYKAFEEIELVLRNEDGDAPMTHLLPLTQ